MLISICNVLQNVPEKVGDVMTKKHVWTCNPDTSIDDGAQLVHLQCLRLKFTNHAKLLLSCLR